MSYIDVRQPVTGKLLFRYDPEQKVVEIKHHFSKTADTVDLEKVAEDYRRQNADKSLPPKPD